MQSEEKLDVDVQWVLEALKGGGYTPGDVMKFCSMLFAEAAFQSANGDVDEAIFASAGWVKSRVETLRALEKASVV